MRPLTRIPAALRYHYLHARTPVTLMKAMWQQGLRPSAGALRDSVAYAREVLGSQRFAPWLIAMSTFRGRFCEGWIPDNYMGEVVARRLNQPYGTAAAKTFTARLLPGELLPDLGYLIDGVFYDRDYRPVSRDAFMQSLRQHETIVRKTDGGGSGNAVQLFSSAELDRAVQITGRRRAVFQHGIAQHRTFDDYCVGGTTVRVTTVREPDGTVSARSACVRFTAAADRIIGPGENYQVFVTIPDGSPEGPAVNALWRRMTVHPTNGMNFADVRIPAYTAILAMVLKAHATLPHYACIGWDVMVDRDERPWIVEWNTDYPAVSMAEAVTGPNFRGLHWERLGRSQTP